MQTDKADNLSEGLKGLMPNSPPKHLPALRSLATLNNPSKELLAQGFGIKNGTHTLENQGYKGSNTEQTKMIRKKLNTSQFTERALENFMNNSKEKLMDIQQKSFYCISFKIYGNKQKYFRFKQIQLRRKQK
ncbi:hypothetical protein DSO57_1031331 [Entomophthora muscae]|uniref:Uncharacterized protein n=1 Tax=Entomophthora muscae TaxID=34485 RepID=A0ACC2SQJ3_9FUNG|nr:hypothetical protein DSO57_1031331 [Entomophthora muscae]